MPTPQPKRGTNPAPRPATLQVGDFYLLAARAADKDSWHEPELLVRVLSQTEAVVVWDVDTRGARFEPGALLKVGPASVWAFYRIGNGGG
jgi:hypothetical protein